VLHIYICDISSLRVNDLNAIYNAKVNYELEQVGWSDLQNLEKDKKEKSEKNPAITIASFLPSYNDPLTT